MSTRSTEAPVDAQFTSRWSPRAYSGEAVSAQALMSLFEAARWTPSSYNTQPWRFVYALAGSAGFGDILGTLIPFNQSWASRASALIAVCSATEVAGAAGEAAATSDSPRGGG